MQRLEHSLRDSLRAWEANAQFWDDAMGDISNQFHRDVVRPGVTQLLNPRSGDRVLDAACGNGNYSAFMAEMGARVVAFDYSPRMIALARKRQQRYLDRIEFHVADATDRSQLLPLAGGAPFDKAVSNMAVMDMTEITPLFESVYAMLKPDGIFVFATQHPCFVTLTDRYVTPHSYEGEAISGQPQLQCYYHRSLQDIFQVCFSCGFVIDGFREACDADPERPDVIIVRAAKAQKPVG